MKYLKSISVIYRLVTISSFNLTSNNIFHMMILLQKFYVFCLHNTQKKMINKQLSKQWMAHDFFGNSPLPPSCTYDFSYITNLNFKAGLVEQSVLKVEKQCNTKSVQKWLQYLFRQSLLLLLIAFIFLTILMNLYLILMVYLSK